MAPGNQLPILFAWQSVTPPSGHVINGILLLETPNDAYTALWLFNTQSRVQQADQFIFQINEKASLNIDMPYLPPGFLIPLPLPIPFLIRLPLPGD